MILHPLDAIRSIRSPALSLSNFFGDHNSGGHTDQGQHHAEHHAPISAYVQRANGGMFICHHQGIDVGVGRGQRVGIGGDNVAA